MSRTGRRRFRALTGTGRAHPKPASTNASAPERVDVRQRIEREPSREARRRVARAARPPSRARPRESVTASSSPGTIRRSICSAPTGSRRRVVDHSSSSVPSRAAERTARAERPAPGRPRQASARGRSGGTGASQRAARDSPSTPWVGRTSGSAGRPRAGGRRRSRRHRSGGARGRARAAGHRAPPR